MGPVGSRCGRPASRGGSREARPRWERRSGGPRSGTAGQGTCSTPSPAIPGRPRFQWSSPLERFQWSSPLEASRRAGHPAPGRTCGGRTHSPAGALAAHPGPHPARENGTYSSRERYLWAVRTVLITWTGQGPGCGSQAVRFSLPVGVSASCVGVGPSSAGPRAATWGCLLVVRGPGPGPEVAGEAVVAASGVFIGGLGGGVAHSSWYLGRAVGVIPTFSRPGRRR